MCESMQAIASWTFQREGSSVLSAGMTSVQLSSIPTRLSIEVVVEFGRVLGEQHETARVYRLDPSSCRGRPVIFRLFDMQDREDLELVRLASHTVRWSSLRIGDVQVFVYDGTKQSAELRINPPSYPTRRWTRLAGGRLLEEEEDDS